MSIHSCSWTFLIYYFMLKPANSEGTLHPLKNFDRKLP